MEGEQNLYCYFYDEFVCVGASGGAEVEGFGGDVGDGCCEVVVGSAVGGGGGEHVGVRADVAVVVVGVAIFHDV